MSCGNKFVLNCFKIVSIAGSHPLWSFYVQRPGVLAGIIKKFLFKLKE